MIPPTDISSASPAPAAPAAPSGHEPGFRPHREPHRIRRMFADIAPTYDLLNHLLSANTDRRWRRAAVRMAGLRPGDRILDVCTGTGDLAFELAFELARAAAAHPRPAPAVIGADFCPEMIDIAAAKRRRRAGAGAPIFLVADALRLPFPDASFDVVTVGFGIRNVGDLLAGLREMRRVLRPEGRAVILEFTTPRSALFRKIFHLYFHSVLPRIGRWLSAAPRPLEDNAYRYLPESVSRFPDAPGLERALLAAGFDTVLHRPLTFGIAAVHVGAVAATGARPQERAAASGSGR